MGEDSQQRVTEILTELASTGGRASAEDLFPLVYDKLRQLAQRYMARERPEHTLQPTALVHEAYLRLVDQSRVNWQGRTHFFAGGAGIMRRILIDHARDRHAAKRGAGWRRVTLEHAVLPSPGHDLDPEQLLSLNAALEGLAKVDKRAATIVELRFFGGLSVPEVANVLGVSKRTIESDWTHAKAWLKRELANATSGD